MSACLDAWALIAMLTREPAPPRARDLIAGGGCAMSWINVGEVRYTQARRRPEEDVLLALSHLTGFIDLIDVTGPRVMRAAELKARSTVSYADCFAATTAIELRLPLATGDAGLLALDEPGLEVIDLR